MNRKYGFSERALRLFALAAVGLASAVFASPAPAASFFFSTGLPDGRMAMASRPAHVGVQETEAADDFPLPTDTSITSASFTGLLPLGASTGDVSQVVVEIYRIFPQDSDTVRTPNVPTRTNSPSDVAFDARDSAGGTLSYSATLLSPSFTAANSVDTGIHPSPNQMTGGEGPVTGEEVQFDVTFNPALTLPAGHYFFVPQVQLTNPDLHFLWLSAPKPIVPPGTPFMPDLQAWIRNADLDPDWLRVGTDIVGNTTFNGTFSLLGTISDVTPPTCSLIATIPGPPKSIQVVVQDTGSGVNTIVDAETNAVTVVAPFVPGDTSPILVTSTKVNQTLASSLKLTVTDVAGNTRVCDPVVPGVKTRAHNYASRYRLAAWMARLRR